MDKIEVIRNYGSLSLAYIGDAVYELYVREYILKTGTAQNGKMHVKTRSFVSSHSQNEYVLMLEEYLYDDEKDVVRRGRNVKSHSHPKNADIAEYHNATGFEALWGYLHLSGDTDRMNELFNKILEYRNEAL